MKNSKKIIICVLSIAIVASIIALVMLIKTYNNDNPNQEVIQETSDKQDGKIQEKIDELKEDLGKGKNGDVVDVIEGQDENNNKTYTYVHEDGNSQTITIRKAEEGEKTETIDPEDIIQPSEEDNQDQDPPIEENLGTVYEKFMAMTSSEQSSFYKSFENPEDFYTWFDAAEQEYNRLHPKIVVGKDEVIDFGN